jgi:nucleoside 2-deoxyribosyltransferase
MVKDSRALFAFLTYNSVLGETRDWIIFEIGAAVAHGIPVFSWRDKSLLKDQLPRMLEQVSRYRDFELSGDGVIKLTSDIRSAAKSLN